MKTRILPRLVSRILVLVLSVSVASQTLPASAQVDSVSLGLSPHGIAALPDGKSAVVWGGEPDVNEFGGFQGVGARHVALVDLVEREVGDTIELDQDVVQVWTTDQYAFVLGEAYTILYRYDLPDFSNRKRLFIGGELSGYFMTSDGNLMLTVTTSDGYVQKAIDIESFRIREVEANIFIDGDPLYFAFEYGAGVSFELRQYHTARETGERLSLSSRFAFPILLLDDSIDPWDLGYDGGFDDFFGDPSSPRSTGWGRRVSDQRLLDKQSSPISSLDVYPVEICESYPVAVGLTYGDGFGGGDLKVSYIELQEGLTIAQQRLAREDRNGRAFPSGPSALQIVRDLVLVTQGTRLHIAEIPDEAQQAAPPLHVIAPKLAPFHVEDGAEFQIESAGGSGDKRYELNHTFEGISIDEETGVVSIDSKEMWMKALSHRKTLEQVNEDFMPNPHDLLQAMGIGLRDAEMFRLTTGMELEENREAFSIPVHVSVRDDEGQYDRLTFYAVLVAPINGDDELANDDHPSGDGEPDADGGDGVSTEKESVVITLSMFQDGSGVFVLTEESASYRHKHFSRPTRVKFNDEAWTNLGESPEAWSELAPLLDLQQARVTTRVGRDTIALETMDDGIRVFVADALVGGAEYSITFEVPYK